MVGVTGLECKVNFREIFILLWEWRFYGVLLMWCFSCPEVVSGHLRRFDRIFDSDLSKFIIMIY